YLVTVVLTPFFFVISMTVFTYIIGNWFVKNRGLALSLASMGSGIGGMIMNTVIARLIIAFGWRATYIVLGVMMLVLMLPLMIFVVREKPADKGMLPYGADEEGEEDKGGKKTAASEGITFAEAVRMPVFWAVCICSVGMVMAICAFYQTLSPHLSDSGYTVTFAATMASISMGALAIGKIALGRMFDTLGIRKTVFIACSCTIIGSVSMLFCTSKIALVLIVLGVGLGCSFGAICMPMITQNIFGMKEYNSIYSKFTAATGLGSAIAPVITGSAYDTFGSYDPAYIGAAVVATIGLVILMIALPKEAKK
ncbi:MAG: MFS transporter, partial [Clostridia bacterium]|nr:MFS transporter [Clostridia bacterium]